MKPSMFSRRCRADPVSVLKGITSSGIGNDIAEQAHQVHRGHAPALLDIRRVVHPFPQASGFHELRIKPLRGVRCDLLKLLHQELINLGLRDVAALADCVADAPGDPGDAELLARYAEWRRSDQKKLVRFTDGLVRLFGDSRPLVPTLRDIGMLGFDLVPGVRSAFARHTMGLAGRLPRLSRGVPLT